VLVGAAPALSFAVSSAEPVRYAAVPTVSFGLRIESDAEINALMLSAQIRIAAPARAYDEPTQTRLVDLFGEPTDWGRTLRSLLWTHATLLVPAFADETTVELPVACTYDFDVAAAKYFHALADGDVPLEFLFSGTVFYTDDGALRTARISWESEAVYRLPIEVWKQAVDSCFPGTAWLRVPRDVFDRLTAYRTARMLPTWESVLDELLERGE
jgi:Family of unknown function (DUF6084)